MEYREIYINENGEVSMASPRKTIMQFSHNSVIYKIYVPKTINFNSASIVYKNEFNDKKFAKILTINTDYESEEYYQILFSCVQPMTDEYGRLDCWLVLRNGTIQILYSDTIYLYVQKSQVILNDTIESDLATELQQQIADNSQDIILIKQELIDASTGDVIIITFEGSSGGGRKQIFNDTNVSSYLHEEDDIWLHASTTYSITSNLTNCTLSNSQSVEEGQSYSATVTPNTDYTISSIVVTMGGSEITAVTGNSIYIANVTGNIVITASATFNYTVLSYIQSSGNSYIDTGIYGNTTDGEISSVIDFEQTQSLGDNSILACRTGGDRLYLLHCYCSYTIGYGTFYQSSRSCVVGTRFTATTILSAGNQKLNIDGTNVYSNNLAIAYNLGYTFYLFACNQGGPTYYANGVKLYSCKIYKSEVLVRDFIPVNNGTENGLYDLVNNQFYANSGTGSFTGQ